MPPVTSNQIIVKSGTHKKPLRLVRGGVISDIILSLQRHCESKGVENLHNVEHRKALQAGFLLLVDWIMILDSVVVACVVVFVEYVPKCPKAIRLSMSGSVSTVWASSRYG